MFYLFVALKVPIVLAGLLVWWAVRQEPDVSEDHTGGDGPRRRRHHPRPPLPRTPRRGPHGDPLPSPPPRVRAVRARARQLDR
jgi:hypothetical protein